jgi:ABC-type sugar transport system permease subunit
MTGHASPAGRSSRFRLGPTSSLRRRGLIGLLFIAPIGLLFIAFSIFPTIFAMAVSLTEYNLFTPPVFVGLDNYVDLVDNRNFWRAVQVTVFYTLYFGPASVILGFSLAMLLRDHIAGRTVFRSLFFIPTILSAVAMALAWSLLLRLDGPVNAVLGITVPWLTNSQTALIGIAMLGVWQSVGFFMVIFLAGLASIPSNLYEAATVDGARGWHMLRYITLPLLRPVLAVVVVQMVVAGMKVFSPMFIMTGGGPNNATRSVAMLIYHEGLRDLRMGTAAAISVLGFLAMMVITVLYLRIFRVHEDIGHG